MLTEISIAAVIVCVCLLVHVAAMLLMADWLLGKREHFLRVGTRRHYSLVVIAVFSGIILLHVAEGLTNREIAAKMFLAEKTVKNYVSSLLAKLGLERRTQAAVLATKLLGEHR